MENKFNYRTPVLLLFMLVIVGLRVIAPLSSDFKLIAGFSGIGAMALFGGAYFKNKVNAFLLPVLVLLLSDLGLVLTMGVNYGFYSGMYLTYIAFILMLLTGHLIIRRVSVQSVFLAAIVGVLIHWVVSDIGVWYGSAKFPQTLYGFWLCLLEAVPYEKNFLYGTLGYSALLFGVFESLKIKYPALSVKSPVQS